MTVYELIQLLQTAPPHAHVGINGQEYHPSGQFRVDEFCDGSLLAIDLDVDLGLGEAFGDAYDTYYREHPTR